VNLLISPHNDDETLFAAFTLCRERETIWVVVVFDGYVQALRGEPVTHLERRAETVAALKELGVVNPPIFGGFNDAEPDWVLRVGNFLRALKNNIDPTIVYVPQWETSGHEQHNVLCSLVTSVWMTGAVIKYTTYTTAGKSVGRREIHPEPDWAVRKLRALACYRSQITVENCREHFMRGLHEYYA
jgi:LmbE family N-acetylglucosaminyl deacetylase